MKKLVAVEADKVEVVEVDTPRPADDQVMVRGVRSLLSPGSELKRIRPWPSYRRSWPNHDLGYAMTGIVEEVGARVQGLKPGDHVMTGGHHQQFVITNGPFVLPSPAGSLSPHLDRGPALLVPLPDDMDWDVAPFTLWSRSCINWMNRAAIRHNESVVVVGNGLVGLLMIMWSRLSNPRQIIAVDLFQRRRDLAARVGADAVLDPSEVDVVEAVNNLTDGGAEVALHCVGGTAGKAFETSQQVTRNGGRVILIGHHADSLNILPRQFTGKDLLGANVGYNSDPRLALDGIKLIHDGNLPVREIITHKQPYTEAPKIYDMLINSPGDSGAILLEWDV